MSIVPWHKGHIYNCFWPTYSIDVRKYPISFQGDFFPPSLSLFLYYDVN